MPMIMGHRIEERIKAAGISQAELARRVGIDQSTINGLIRVSGRSSRYLHVIARELGTTPSYLTGETDNPAGEAPDEVLTGHEREWLQVLRQLDQGERKIALTVARALAKAAGQDIDHPTVREYRTGTGG